MARNSVNAETMRPPLGGPPDVFFKQPGAVAYPMITRAAGIYMWDEYGNQYIDVSSGPVVSNIGHGNAHVAERIAEQARTMDFAYGRVARHRPGLELAERIASLAGAGYERVCFASGGSEAMELALKFLRQYAVATGARTKRRIVSCAPSYHGGTVATLAITGDESLDPFLDGFAIPSTKVPAPFTYRVPNGLTAEDYADYCADALESTILALGPGNVLAFVIEPVGGVATGCLVPPARYFRRVREICNRHNVHLVFDEVLCGTGRTGKFLTAQHWPNDLPDLVVLAKGLGSGYAPLGAMLAPRSMVDRLADLTGFNFSHTYCANPIACAAGLAVLDEYDRLDLVGRAERLGAYLRAKLETLQASSPIVGEVRGLGLLMAIELVADRTTKTPLPLAAHAADAIRAHGLRNGLMIYSRRTNNGRYGDWFIVAPPLMIETFECDLLVERLGRTIGEFVAALRHRGVIG